MFLTITVAVASAAVAALAPEHYPGYGYEPTTEDYLGEAEYSPYLHQGFPQRVSWGDTHLHTSYSTDAGMKRPGHSGEERPRHE